MAESTMGAEEKLELEDRFWLMIIRAGSMDSEQAFQVLINYWTIMNTYPQYFAFSRRFLFLLEINLNKNIKIYFSKSIFMSLYNFKNIFLKIKCYN